MRKQCPRVYAPVVHYHRGFQIVFQRMAYKQGLSIYYLKKLLLGILQLCSHTLERAF